jgi:RNA polymerase sigma factor (sigma-70 family)
MFIEPSIGHDAVGSNTDAFEIINEWVLDGEWNQLTLLGDVGTGKSFLSRMIAYRLVQDYQKAPLESPLPILIDLRNADRQFSLEGLILTHFARTGLSQVSFEVFQHALSQGQIVLILDGFDEMAARVTPQVTSRNFHELARSVQGRAKVLLTCRTHYFKSRTEVEEVILGQKEDYGSETARDLYWELISRKGFRVAYLRPFDIAQVEEYVMRARPYDYTQALSKIRNTYNLMELSHRPMLLKMIVKSIDKLTASEINASTLYKVFTDAWIHRDLWREVLSPDAKLSFLVALARSLWEDDLSSVHYTVLNEYVRQELAAQIQDPQQLVEIDSEIRTASFLTRDDAGNYGFAHKSYAEFFFARYLTARLRQGDLECLHTRRLTHEVISFLKDMIDTTSVEKKLEAILREGYRPLVSENALICLYGFSRSAILTNDDLDEIIIVLPRGAQLNGAQLDQITLEGATLIEANLTGAILTGAVLSNTDLTKAVLSKAVLDKADLSGASLVSATLAEANCVGTNFESADLSDVNLTDTNLTDAYLLRVRYVDTDFNKAKLTRAVLPVEFTSVARSEFYDKQIRPIVAKSGLLTEQYWGLIEELYTDILNAARVTSFRYDADPEEVASEVALRLVRTNAIKELLDKSPREQKNYLYWFAQNVSREQVRKIERFSGSRSLSEDLEDYIDKIPSTSPSPYDELLVREMERDLQQGIEEILSVQLQRIVKAHYFDEVSLADIAEAEGVSLKSVYRRLSKARELLKAHFRQGGFPTRQK